MPDEPQQILQKLATAFARHKAEWLGDQVFQTFTEPTYFPELAQSLKGSSSSRTQDASSPTVFWTKTDEVRWVEAVVGRRPRRKAEAKPTTVGLIVHGPRAVRIEIHEERQVDWAAKLLRSLDEAKPC